MAEKFDEISLKYWDENKQKRTISKSYSCVHNGYVYGDAMQATDIQFVYVTPTSETVIKGKNHGPKWAYYALVEKACAMSSTTLSNFLHNNAEKFRIYSPADVAAFTEIKRNSTRIRDDSCKIRVEGKDYYVANNLKICEYFNSAAMNIDHSGKGEWYIRIFFDEDDVQLMDDRNETEEIDAERMTYTLTLQPTPTNSHMRSSSGSGKVVKVDFLALGMAKKRVGDLGELLAIDYEKKRLTGEGREDLAAKIVHTSRDVGDGTGYDIQSFLKDGTPVYIEVKTTRQNRQADFFLSKREKEVSDQMATEGKPYKIYRIYNLNPRTGTGNIIIYDAPIDRSRFNLAPENWKISIKE